MGPVSRAVTFREFDEETQELRLVAAWTDLTPAESVPRSIPTGSVTSLAYREERIVIANDYASHPETIPGVIELQYYASPFLDCSPNERPRRPCGWP